MSAQNNIPLVIPDKIIVDTLNQCLNIIRDDYNTTLIAGHVDESLLYLLLNGIGIGKYDLLDNAVEIFITTPQHPKNIEVRLGYDHTSQQTAPTVFITLPSENTINNSIGIGEGNQDELLFARNDPDPDEYRAQYIRRWLATYNVVIITENRNEMLVIYNVLKSMIIACINHFEMSGLSNLKIGGQDLSMLQIPDRAFKRAITMNFEYEQVVPSLVIKNIFRKIRLYWKPDGATIPQGPIEIDNDDDLSPSSSS